MNTYYVIYKILISHLEGYQEDSMYLETQLKSVLSIYKQIEIEIQRMYIDSDIKTIIIKKVEKLE